MRALVAGLTLSLLAACASAPEDGATTAPKPEPTPVPEWPLVLDREPEPPASAASLVEAFPAVRVVPARGERLGRVEVDATVCLDAGWLEQVACMERTREHESLLVVHARPSHVHAGLLLAGFEPGAPGEWRATASGRVLLEPPRGAALRVRVRWTDPADGTVRTAGIHEWMRDGNVDELMAARPWIFGGSILDPDVPAAPYVADRTGSVVGLVTFGDEVVGFEEVIPDATDIRPPAWEAVPEAMPPVGTPAVLLLDPWTED